jgi:glyoxylate reductase
MGTDRPQILLTRRIPASVLARLQSAGDVDFHEGPAPLTPDELRARVRGKHAIVCLLTDRITDDVLAAGADLRIVADIAVGYDNIDVKAAKARGVIVTNTPDVLTEAVAEFTWGLILAAARRIAEGDRLIRAGQWKGWALDFMLGTELRGKQLGIIGGGRIGRAVAAKAPAFGMTAVFAARRTGPAGRSSEGGGGRGARSHESGGAPILVSLDELLVTSDVISVHVPGGAGTRHLIDRRVLARMKRSAILINTARGSVVDEEALAWALQERLIAAAALDVYEHEPAVHPALLGADNVVLVPHLGSATRETRTAMADLAVGNVIAVLEGRPPITPV